LDTLIFRGAWIKISGANNPDDNEFYILTENHDSERPFVLIRITGYKAGIERGFIRGDKIQTGTVGITREDLIDEIQWNFPDVQRTGIEIYDPLESESIAVSK
jgi:hypothetical protein